jgi:hypothetical protein
MNIRKIIFVLLFNFLLLCSIYSNNNEYPIAWWQILAFEHNIPKVKIHINKDDQGYDNCFDKNALWKLDDNIVSLWGLSSKNVEYEDFIKIMLKEAYYRAWEGYFKAKKSGVFNGREYITKQFILFFNKYKIENKKIIIEFNIDEAFAKRFLGHKDSNGNYSKKFTQDIYPKYNRVDGIDYGMKVHANYNDRFVIKSEINKINVV